MARGLCLLGTDTAVGKTTVACGILRLAFRKGLRLLPFKPVETGCDEGPTDAARLARATGLSDLDPSSVTLYRFPQPVAPSVAARLAGRPIDLDTIVDRGRELLRAETRLLVETAGGVLTPYGPDLTSASLVERLVDVFAFDVLLVSANRLGTINQTALALEHLHRTRCGVAGLILVNVDGDDTPDRPWNAAEIRALTAVPLVGTLRHCPSDDPEHLADAVAADLDLRPVFGGALAG
jgi:dethiobiotin synthetase